MTNTILTSAIRKIENMNCDGNTAIDTVQVENTIVNYAAASSLAAMAAGVVPGVGGLAACAVSVGAIWAMYVKLCNVMKIEIGKNKLKALASAVGANIVTQMSGMMLLSFIPGLSIISCGAINFTTVYFAGIIFLHAMAAIGARSSVEGKEMSAEELKDICACAAKEYSAKTVYQEATETFGQMKKDGTLQEAGNRVDINNVEE